MSSTTTGQVLLAPRAVPAMQGMLTWKSPDSALLAKHGTLDRTLGQGIQFGAVQQMQINYQARKEPADGHGFLVKKPATLTASVPVRDLVMSVYDIPPAAQGLLLGDRTESARIQIEWHAAGINLVLYNTYNINLTPTSGLDFAFGGHGHTDGIDAASGFLELQDDGTYNGLLTAVVNSNFDGEWGGYGCVRHFLGSQTLYATGTKISGGNLQLRFYPTAASPIWQAAPNTCYGDPLLGYQGYDAAGNTVTGKYLPFANARWNVPEIGYSVYLPSESNPEWIYEDDDENSEYGTSVWRIRTTLVRGS
jgi:hypothetical protein